MDKLSLDTTTRSRLIEIARGAIAHELGVAPAPDTDGEGLLAQRYGVFVTLTVNSRLRGCIGSIEGERPLGREVAGMAVAAASSDPRFRSIDKSELPHLQIEISIMSPLYPIASAEDIRIGTHGLVVERGTQRGLLLPQVATERGWNAETFLAYTCEKAGLPRDAWQADNVNLFCFSATIVSETD